MTATTPPHLAELTLTYVQPEGIDEYLAAVMRGFHGDIKPDEWDTVRAVLEPERNFGFTAGGRWVSTTGAFTRTMVVPGGTVATAAVTVVTVAPAFRRRGLLRRMMTHQLEQIAAAGTEPVALLWASEHAIYGRFGYGETLSRLRLSGPTRELAFAPGTDVGLGSVGEVERSDFLPVAARLREGWLAERPGALSRSDAWWDFRLDDPENRRHGASAYRFALHYAADGTPDGYAFFRVKEEAGEVEVVELDAADTPAYAALWRFLLSLDLVRSFRLYGAPVDEPLRLLVTDPRAITAETLDGTYARLVDVPAALTARRYPTEIDLVLGVRDELLPRNDAVFRLRGGPDGADVERTSRTPDVSLGVRELGALYLGGVSPATLRRAGLVVEQTPGSLARMAAGFAYDRLPYCNDFF